MNDKDRISQLETDLRMYKAALAAAEAACGLGSVFQRREDVVVPADAPAEDVPVKRKPGRPKKIAE